MFCPAKHLSTGMKLERKGFRAFCMHTMSSLVSPGHLHPCLCLSPHLYLHSLHRCSHHVCQHQHLKLNYWLEAPQNRGNGDYNQTRGSAIQRCLYQTYTPCSSTFLESLNKKHFIWLLCTKKSVCSAAICLLTPCHLLSKKKIQPNPDEETEKTSSKLSN